METLTPLLAVITGLALRLAIPILITAAIISILRRLDAHWQLEAQIQSHPVPISVEKPRCWEITACECPDAERETCPGYQTDQPCWQAFRNENGYLLERCLSCEVFLNAPIPAHEYAYS